MYINVHIEETYDPNDLISYALKRVSLTCLDYQHVCRHAFVRCESNIIYNFSQERHEFDRLTQ